MSPVLINLEKYKRKSETFQVPFMADECVLALAGVEEVDYTVKRYMELVAAVGQCRERLGGDWTAHQVATVGRESGEES